MAATLAMETTSAATSLLGRGAGTSQIGDDALVTQITETSEITEITGNTVTTSTPTGSGAMVFTQVHSKAKRPKQGPAGCALEDPPRASRSGNKLTKDFTR